jgi:hypothetical protein
VIGNLRRWSAYRRWHALRNDPDLAVQVWAFARNPGSTGDTVQAPRRHRVVMEHRLQQVDDLAAIDAGASARVLPGADRMAR